MRDESAVKTIENSFPIERNHPMIQQRRFSTVLHKNHVRRCTYRILLVSMIKRPAYSRCISFNYLDNTPQSVKLPTDWLLKNLPTS